MMQSRIGEIVARQQQGLKWSASPPRSAPTSGSSSTFWGAGEVSATGGANTREERKPQPQRPRRSWRCKRCRVGRLYMSALDGCSHCCNARCAECGGRRRIWKEKRVGEGDHELEESFASNSRELATGFVRNSCR